MRAAMPDGQRALAIAEARRFRLGEGAVVLASTLAHVTILLCVFLLGSPRLLATVPPSSIIVDIVRPEELTKGALTETASGQKQEQPAQQQQPQQPQQRQAQQPQQQQQQQQQAPSAAAAPVFTSLFPWPVARTASDTQAGDYRTFETTEKLDHDELAGFKARLKECWKPPAVAASARKLTAAVRVALRIDGSLAGPPELVEATASPYGPALVESAMRAVNQCGPYGFLPADSYDTWKRLSLTFSPDDVAVAVVVK
jgi:hypothetical protein